MRFDLSDEEWAAIEPLLPLRLRGSERVDDRNIHAVVNEKGRLIRAVITGGQVHDSQAIPALFEAGLNTPLALAADKAYGSKAIRLDLSRFRSAPLRAYSATKEINHGTTTI